MAIQEASDLDCRKCSDDLKVMRGCEEETGCIIVDGVEYKRCPLKIITHQTWEIMRFYGFYEKGILPTSEGLLEQTSKFLDVISFIRREQYRLDKKRIASNGK